MKRFFAFIAIICAVSFCSAQNGSKAKTESSTHNGAEIKFEKTVCDLGTVKLNQVVTDTYTFTNIGKKPLLLYNVVSSCNCTKVEYSKEPVMPGKKGTIKVTFSATEPKDVGARSKRITVDSNAESDRVILTLKANVVME